MEIITIILGIALVVCVFLLFRRTGGGAPELAADRPARIAVDDGGLKEQLSEARKELAKLRQDVSKKDNELKQAREGGKSNKQRQAEKLKSLESDKASLQNKVKSLEKKLSGLGSAEDAREEMLVLERRVLELEDELRRGVRSPAPAAAVAPGGATLAMTAVGAPEADDAADEPALPDGDTVSVDEHRDAIRKVRAQTKAQIKELKDSFFTQLKQERSATKDELANMRQRLRRALNDMERERRRSDNTDRAYVILKGQLEGALDRLAQFDPHLRRPDTIDPAQHLRELEELQAQRQASAAASAEEPAVEEAAEVSGGAAEVTESSADSSETTDGSSSSAAEAAAEVSTGEGAVAVAPATEDAGGSESAEPAQGALSLGDVDDDGWMDDEVEAKLTGGFKTV